YTILKNVNIEDNVRVYAFSVIEGSEIKKNSTVGPFARLRNGVVVGENCRIGNFVEIKNSVIGSKTKASHLSYIGDAEIGKDVNIGAGAITCNYDGKVKHKTTIEDNVFVGSNTSLVAPIKIKKGATIGAGSCITLDAPAKSLNVGRAKQTTIKNWKKN
ncbi:MAG: DapH/DapD/GlmU-related protein, partial [Burkholderiaceae bacterium]